MSLRAGIGRGVGRGAGRTEDKTGGCTRRCALTTHWRSDSVSTRSRYSLTALSAPHTLCPVSETETTVGLQLLVLLQSALLFLVYLLLLFCTGCPAALHLPVQYFQKQLARSPCLEPPAAQRRASLFAFLIIIVARAESLCDKRSPRSLLHISTTAYCSVTRSSSQLVHVVFLITHKIWRIFRFTVSCMII